MARTRLKIERVRKGWTQQEAAERLGMSVSGYSRIESGENWPTLKTWEKIKEIYHLKDGEMWEIQHEGIDSL